MSSGVMEDGRPARLFEASAKTGGTPVLHHHEPRRGRCRSICHLTWFVVILWLNCRFMFARRIRVEYEENGRRVACP